jgi:hypothetical protein
MPKENDLEGAQDQGGKHGGQAGMPRPADPPNSEREAQRDRKDAKKGPADFATPSKASKPDA